VSLKWEVDRDLEGSGCCSFESTILYSRGETEKITKIFKTFGNPTEIPSGYIPLQAYSVVAVPIKSERYSAGQT